MSLDSGSVHVVEDRSRTVSRVILPGVAVAAVGLATCTLDPSGTGKPSGATDASSSVSTGVGGFGGTGGVAEGSTGTAGSNGVGGTDGGMECMTANDCPGIDTECQFRTCDNQVCGFDYTSAGTVIAAQVAGDCRRIVCNGIGGEIDEIDMTDILDDGKQCTVDQCDSNGMPTNTPATEGTDCTENGGLVCDGAGTCKCNPSDPNSITILKTDNPGCFKTLQLNGTSSTIVQEGSSPDSVNCQPYTICMNNLPPSSNGVIVAQTMNGAGTATLQITAPLKNPAFDARCISAGTPGWTTDPVLQATIKTTVLSGGNSLVDSENWSGNQVTLQETTCPPGTKWVMFNAFVGP